MSYRGEPFQSSAWRVANHELHRVRFKPRQNTSTDIYFARLKVQGKLIRHRSITHVLSVAKLRLPGSPKNLPQMTENPAIIAKGKMTSAWQLRTCSSLQVWWQWMFAMPRPRVRSRPTATSLAFDFVRAEGKAARRFIVIRRL